MAESQLDEKEMDWQQYLHSLRDRCLCESIFIRFPWISVNKTNHAIHWIVIISVDSVIHLSNNPGQEDLMQNRILDKSHFAQSICTSDVSSDIHQEQSQLFKTWI